MSTIARKSVIVPILATSTTILTAGASETCACVSLIVGNIDGTNDATIDLHLHKSGGSSVDIATNINIGAGTMVQIFIGGKDSLFLENSDALKATASVAGDINVTLSYVSETS